MQRCRERTPLSKTLVQASISLARQVRIGTFVRVARQHLLRAYSERVPVEHKQRLPEQTELVDCLFPSAYGDCESPHFWTEGRRGGRKLSDDLIRLDALLANVRVDELPNDCMNVALFHWCFVIDTLEARVRCCMRVGSRCCVSARGSREI